MTESRRAEELYHSTLARPEDEREAFLAEACGRDLDRPPGLDVHSAALA